LEGEFLRITTLKEFGPQLPIGMLEGTTLQKNFTLRPFKGWVDRSLGLWREANGDRYTSQQMAACMVGKLLSLLVEQAGKKAFALTKEKDSTPESELSLYQWNMCDVIYAYVYARKQALGNELRVPIGCTNPNCKYVDPSAVFDLDTLEVRSAENLDDTFAWVSLTSPIMARDGKTKISSIRVEPLKWTVMTQPGFIGGTNQHMDAVSLQSAAVAINKHEKSAVNGVEREGYPYTLVESEVDEITKRDYLIINERIGELSMGIDITTAIPCPKCGMVIINPLDWEYGNFFGSSFRAGI